MTAPRRWSHAEVGALIGRSAKWVREHAHEYQHHRIGASRVFFDEDVTALLEATRVRPDTHEADDELRPIPSGRRT